MIGLDICSWTGDSEHWCFLYNTELALSIATFVITLFIFVFAFSGDRFNPHTAMMRAFLFGDLVHSFALMMESLTALLPEDVSIRHSLGPPRAMFVSISECVIFRPYLFLISMSRQWIAVLALIVGLERFLFICYPLWFKVVRVRRIPIIMFVTCYVALSSSIGYTNSLVVAPDEQIHFTCDSTWAFGDHFGWCQAFVIIVSVTVGWCLNYYAFTVASEERSLMLFGNNRGKMNSERRKIRKAMWMLTIVLICVVLPQIAIVCLRLIDRWRFQPLKLIANQVFMLKALGNMLMVRQLSRGSSIWKVSVRIWCCCFKPVRKTRQVVDNCESIASISKYVH
ncbi:hypothetical protein M3Y97_00691800 [Aphelenchoides bicaudatus]|nr:hypothetical protein M3Y97_00691800 [Aphelenchoides bicaudatus]